MSSSVSTSSLSTFKDFPLYTSLKRDNFKELTEQEKDQLCEFLNSLSSKDEAETVWALIRAYHLDNDVQIQDIPYGGRSLKTGHKFDVDFLPSKLQYILFQFSKLKNNL
jgi:hypothetical protein